MSTNNTIEFTNDEAFGWDDDVQAASGGEFKLLTPGYGIFTVKAMERGRFKGSAKMQACYKATLSLEVTDLDSNTTTVESVLFLNKKMAFKLTAFFKSTGLIDEGTKDGESFRMPWSKVVGTSGFCEIAHRSWTGDDGKERKSNDIRRYLHGETAMRAAHEFNQASAAGTEHQVASAAQPVQTTLPVTQQPAKPFGGDKF